MCPVAPGDGRRVSMPRDACWEQRAEPCLNDTSPPSWFEWYFTYVFLGVLLYNTYEIVRRHSVCIFCPEWATAYSVSHTLEPPIPILMVPTTSVRHKHSTQAGYRWGDGGD